MANIYETRSTAFSRGQRFVSLTLGVACSIPLTSAVAMANVPAPPSLPNSPSGGWQGHLTAFVHPLNNGASFGGVSSSTSSARTTLVHTAPAALSRSTVVSLNTALVSGGVLNLASSSLSFLAGNLSNFQSLTINVGGRHEVVSLNTKLTGAEVVAFEQVRSGAGQSIKLTTKGVADGGQVSLNSTMLTALDGAVGGSLSSLTIAKGVQVVDSLNVLSLSGGLSNYGSLLTAASASGRSDTISAGTILNAAGGAIGSYSGGSGLVGADANLVASTSLTNNGSISSVGNLNISAPVVSNVANHGSAASINAGGDVNISTATLNNSGTIAASTGNVNLSSAGALTLNGAGGTLQANNGSINLTAANSDINVNGGNMLSQQVNMNAGTGNVYADVDQTSGVVNADGYNVHINGNTSTLDLGNVTASGDPIFTNTGSLDVSGTVSATKGNPLTLIAGTNVISTASGTIDTSSTTGPGGAITIIAGAAFTPTTPSTGVGVTVTKGSATGGTIDFSGNNNNSDGSTGPITAITSASTVGNGGNGGNVVMVAFAGKTVGSGEINTPGSLTTDSSTGTAGSVTLIGGAKTGTAVTTGSITATGVTDGAISAYASTPTIEKAKGTTGVVFDSTGALTSGSFVPTKTPNAGNIFLGDVQSSIPLVITTGASASVANSTADLNLGTITVGKTGIFSAIDSGGNINVLSTITGGTTNLTASGAGGIIATSAGASINTTNANLTTNAVDATGNITVTTDVSNLVFTGAGGNIAVAQTNVKGDPLALTVSGVVTDANATGAVLITSQAQVYVKNQISTAGPSVDITTSNKGGISITGPISVSVGNPNSGTISLDSTGTGMITDTQSGAVTANVVSVTTHTNLGTKAAPFFTIENGTNASLTVNNLGPKTISYLADQSSGAITFTGNLAPITAGGSLFLTSSAPSLTVAAANYATTAITDTSSAVGSAGVIFSGPVGSATGTFTVTSASFIGGNGIVQGTTVTLNGALGVGTAKTDIATMTPNLSLTSANGGVYVTDGEAATVNGSSSLNQAVQFSVTDTAVGAVKTGASLTVGKSVQGGQILLETTGAGSIAVNGAVGTINTGPVTMTSVDSGITTKGAINGAAITLKAEAGNLLVGGIVGAAGSNVLITTTNASPTLNAITIGGVVSGSNISIFATGTLLTTKAISGIGYNSTVLLGGTAGAATSNAITVGGAITGEQIEIVSQTLGGVAINANVGTNAATTFVEINAGANASPATGAITGKAIIGAQAVDLESDTSIGTAKAPISLQASNLVVNHNGDNGTANLTQKGNVSLGRGNSSNLALKVTGTLNIVGPVTTPNLTLSSTGLMTLGAQITDGGIAGTMLITAGGGLTMQSAGRITTTASTGTTVNVTGAANIAGSIGVQTLNLNTSGLLTVVSGGIIADAKDNIVSKGGITDNGVLGSATDVLDVSTTGALAVGSPQIAARLEGAATSTVSALTISNFGTISGDVTLNATGTGNALINNTQGTLGAAGNNIVINALKGTIESVSGSTIAAGTLGLNALVTNMTFGGTTDINSASVKDGLAVTDTSGNLTIGGTTFTVGSATIQYANTINTNTNFLALNNIAATTGNLYVSANAQTLNVSNGSSLTTLAGNITLQNSNGNTNVAAINIGSNVIIHGSGAKTNLAEGNVAIFMGPAGYVAAPGAAPPAGTVTGPVTFASTVNPTGTITASTGDTFTSSGRTLSFNEAGYTTAGGAINVGATTAITADPPSSAGAASTPAIAAANLVSSPMVVGTSAASNISGVSSPAVLSSASTAGSTAAPNAFAVNSLTSSNSSAGSIPGLLSSIVNSCEAEDAGNGAFTQGASTGSVVGGKSKTTAQTGVLNGGVSNNDVQSLERGPLLLSPERNTVVQTPFGSVGVAAHSFALVIVSDNSLAVYNLHDMHKDAVVVSQGNEKISLSPGRALVFSRSQSKSFEEINPAAFVAYRKVARKNLEGAAKVYQAEFDIISIVRGLPAIRHLLTSDSAKQRKTATDMLKTAAIMMQISGSSEPYALYLTPNLTACALSPGRAASAR